MAVSIASQTQSVSWQQVTRKIISGDPLEVLDRLDAACQMAERDRDPVLTMALAANALAFMLVDWSRFTDWQRWIKRFEVSDGELNADVDKDAGLKLMRAVGTVAAALLRGDPNETLAPLGERLESLIDTASEATQLALAGGALLPWLQMSKNPAAAAALNRRMQAAAAERLLESVGVQYLRGAWQGAWALHLHFTGERARLADALVAFDNHLAHVPSPHLQFRRARLAAEQALFAQNIEAADQAIRNMLDAVNPKRPMERVIYNMMASTLASTRKDTDRALLHVTHNLRDLAAADCPPSIASVYRIAESRIYLARNEYAQAATIYEELVQHAHTAHAATYRGYAALARALLAHQGGAASRELLREQLQVGLSLIRSISAVNFLASVGVARAAVCALALREDIEAEFVRDALKASPVSPPLWADEHWPWAMSLRCFGGFRSVGVALDGRGSSKASNRPLSLLMLIAAHGAQGVPVALATDALWPEQDGDQAENSLSVTLLRLRRLYSETDLIERRGGWLHLNPLRVWTDVAALEAHLDAMPAGAATQGEAERLQTITRLFDLYRGDCLFGIDDDWAHRRAIHYRGRVTTAAKQLLQDALRADQEHACERVLSCAFERGLDASRLLDSVRADLPPSTLATLGTRLQSHVEMLKTH